MAYFSVTVDEWLIVNKDSGHGLVTTGLSGCVAVALMTQNRCLLAHVFSGCTLKTWKTYKPHLMKMMEAGEEEIDKGALFYSDEHNNELVTLLRGFLYCYNTHPRLIQDSGCIITTTAPRLVKRVVNGKLATVMSDAKGAFTGLKMATDPKVGNSAQRSHQANDSIFRGGRLDGKQWLHELLTEEDERD